MMDHKLIDKYRYINTVHTDWHKDVKYLFCDMVHEKYGLCVGEIDFELGRGGFANFSIKNSFDLSEFLKRADLDNKYPEWIARGGDVDVDIGHAARTAYQRITISSPYTDLYTAVTDSIDFDPFKHALEQIVMEKSEETYFDLEKDIEKIIDNLGDELYNMLTNEHEYLTSDEVVWETIIANEWDKNEENENQDPGV